MIGFIISYVYTAYFALCRLTDRLERHRRIVRGDVIVVGSQVWAEEMAFIRDGKVTVHTMEAAKDLIGKLDFSVPDDIELIWTLVSIAADKRAERWSRVAAVYVLGFADRDHRSASLIGELMHDPDPWISDHANEVFWTFLREDEDRWEEAHGGAQRMRCDDCDYEGPENYSSETHSFCSSCHTVIPYQKEDRCPNCGDTDCLVLACPQCNGHFGHPDPDPRP